MIELMLFFVGCFVGAGLVSVGMIAAQVSREWTAYRLKIAKQVHDKLTADE